MLSLFSLLWWALRWLGYLIAWLVFAIHATGQFISKPGSRVLVFVPIQLGLFALRGITHPLLEPAAQDLSAIIELDLLAIPFFLDAVIFFATIPAWGLYATFARGLRPIIGAWPSPAYPLPPRRAPKVAMWEPKTVKARLALQRVRRSRSNAMLRAYAALPDEVRGLITSGTSTS